MATAGTWQRAASAAITPMAQQIPTMAEEASEWEQGSLNAAKYQPELSTTLAVMTDARDRVSKLPPYPGQPKVDRLYLASMTLYVASAQADQESLGVVDSGLRQQVALLAERVRELGDRVFDQGRILTGQSLVPAGLAGAKIQLPPAVPDWTAEGLAAGPPLAAAAPASVDRPAPQPDGGSALRARLARLVDAEAQLLLRAAALVGPPVAGPMQAVVSELSATSRMVA
jgi:hypothetical protein